MFFTHSTVQSLNNNHFKKNLSLLLPCLPAFPVWLYFSFSSLLLFNKQLTATTTLICSLIYGVYIKTQHNITIIIKMVFFVWLVGKIKENQLILIFNFILKNCSKPSSSTSKISVFIPYFNRPKMHSTCHERIFFNILVVFFALDTYHTL